MHAQNTCGDSLGDLAATFVKLCPVLCNNSAIVMFIDVERLQRACKLCLTRVFFILKMTREKTTPHVCTFDESILQQ